MSLEVKNLSFARSGAPILSGISFSVAQGELVVIRGKNGVGKSSVLAAMMGLEGIEVIRGDILIDDKSYLSYKTHERARAGIFLAHQEPPVIDGISLGFMCRAALEAMNGEADVPLVQKKIREALAVLNLPENFASKTLHGDMSGGEKKRAELVQMLVLEPKYALLDEIDSGLDAASVALAIRAIDDLRKMGTGFVVVTHSDAFVEALKPTQIVTL
jgi:Fe-S cluster assembly ATP-binding protein